MSKCKGVHLLKSFAAVIGGVALMLVCSVSTLSGKNTDNKFGDYMLSSETSYISMDLDGAKLSDVLKLLSKKTGMNFVPTDAVRNQKITLYLENVPLDETLTTLFETYKLTYEYYPESNIFVVKEKAADAPDVELKTKVYYLKYARIKSTRLEEEIRNFAQNQGTQTTGTNVMESTSTSTTNTGSSTQTAGTEGKGLKEIIEKVLTKEGKVTEEPRINALIVTDHPYQFAMLDSVVEQLDRPVPKVLIEVEILDVVKTLADKLGFSYDSNGDGILATFTPGTLTSQFPFAKRFFRPPVTTTATTGTLNLSEFAVSLKLIKNDTRTRTIARPKILTLSNETAEIKIVTDAAIGLTSTLSPTVGTTTSVERSEVGTKLRVTPQVNPDTGEITLYVEASVQGTVDSGLVQAGLTGNIKNPTGRQARTVLRLKDGETLMIGGLISKDETKGKSKVAFLGDIPFLGAAFRSKADSTEDREMLVFITPRLVDDQRAFASIGGAAYPPVRLPSKIHRVKEALDRFEQY